MRHERWPARLRPWNLEASLLLTQDLSGPAVSSKVACEIVSTRGAVFALWGKPTVEDMDRVRDALKLAADTCGHPVVYITRVPRHAPPPDGAARARLDELMPGIVSVCSSYHVVLEGDGFGAAIKRGVLIGLFQLGWRRKTFFVHATVDEVARNARPDERPLVSAILALAATRGLLSDPRAGSIASSQDGERRAS